MIVRWKQERLNVVPVPIQVKTGTKSLTGSNNLVLKPGYNDISEDVWKMIEPLLENHIKDKNIEVLDKDIGDMEDDQILEIMSDTNFPETIDAWLKREKRESVRLILRNRLEEINHYIKTGKKKEEEE